jgi:hypothetical protein
MDRRLGPMERSEDVTPTSLGDRQEKRLRALDHANEVRHARALLRRRIAVRELSAAELILEPPPAVLRWPVAELLTSQPYWGRATCHKFLARNQIDELKTVGALTDRQRRLLADQL